MAIYIPGLHPLRQGLRLHDPQQRVPDPQARHQALREERQEGLAGQPTVALHQERYNAPIEDFVRYKEWMCALSKGRMSHPQ